MSVTLSLDIELHSNKYSDRSAKSGRDIIDLLLQNGWNVVNNEKKVGYLPLGDNGMFNWTGSEMTVEELMLLADEKEKAGELIGVLIYWKDSDIGGHLLINSPDKFSFILVMDTQYIDIEMKIPDYNWYAEKIIPVFNKQYHILAYKFGFIY